MEKTCYKCHETKPIGEFFRNKNKRDGYSSECKECGRERTENYRQRHKEEIVIKKKIDYQKNREVILDQKKVYYLENKEKIVFRRKNYYQTNHGRITKQIEGKRYYQKHKININQRIVEYLNNFPEKYKAKSAVNHAIRDGKLLPANSFICVKCHKRQAHDYHHYLGYAHEHWFDIIALCRSCHHFAHKK